MMSNRISVERDRLSKISSSECIYTNDRMLWFNKKGGIFLISFEFENDLYFELLQIAEVFPSNKWKVYPFTKKTIFLANFTITDLINITINCRFSNNLFMTRFKQIIHSCVPEECIKGIPELDTGAYLRECLVVGDELDIVYDLTEQDVKEKYLEEYSTDKIKVIAYDDILNNTKCITYAIPQLAPYITDWDILDLCNILIEYKNITRQYTFKEFIKRYKSSSIINHLVSKKILTKELVNIDRPLVFEDNESVDEELSDVYVVDSSEIPQSNFITNSNVKGE